MSDPADAVFHEIRDYRVYKSVVDQLTFAIRTGTYAPGDRLPSIEDLSVRMKVSKPVVGEAVKALSVAGVVVAQRGSRGGLRVVSNNVPTTMMGLTAGGGERDLTAVLEARRTIEVGLAVLCGERASDEELDHMQDAIDLLRQQPESARLERVHYDHLFHYCIGRYSRSELLAYYQHQILEQLAIELEDYFLYEENPREVERLHDDTLQALRTRDSDEIRAALDRHLAPLEAAVGSSHADIPEAERWH